MSQYNKAIAGAFAPQISIIVLWALNLAGVIDAPQDVNEVAIIFGSLIMSAVSAAVVYFAPKNAPPPSDTNTGSTP